MPSRPPSSLQPASPEALFRYTVVSQVLARELRGQPRALAVAEVASAPHRTPAGPLRRVGRRTVYRWLAAWHRGGFDALEPAARPRTDSSVVLPGALLAFVQEQKELDPFASLPELVQRARLHGVVPQCTPIHRATLWRACRRLGLDVRRRKATRHRDMRRFTYPHRMQMVLCDGKHFRAGATRARRVAFFFLDDATRLGLHVVVGTSETAALFLRGLYGTLRHHGRMDLVYFDNGSAFSAHDALDTLRQLGIHPVHGEAHYPPGRGAVERFNQTAQAAVLRNLDRRPDVDPACPSLELRLQHYLREVYGHTPHESLDGHTPWRRWEQDDRPLRFFDDDHALRQKFVLYEERRVSTDNVVQVRDVDYEMPRGHAGHKVVVHRHLIDGTVAVLHQGSLVVLHPVDLARNATSGRARRPPPEDLPSPMPPTAAELLWQRDLGPLLGPDGGFTLPDKET